ncbi:MAG TPA: glycosyltransferase [Bryobacteraceae bacterium]|nr:glycosyltransferase [Bryobacteraceae bacterium]
MNLALCMIVRNEEAVLARCLRSVRELAPEIVIVDTGSTDGTPRIAAEHGAKFASFSFERVDFAAARNRSLELAASPWILVLDADELLYPGSAPLIQELISRNDNAGYYFERLNFRPEGQPPATDHAIRLFPNNPAYRYRGRVHETVDDSILAAGGRLLRTPIRVAHEFAADPEARRRRNLLYIGILQEELAEDPENHSRLIFLAAEYHQLGMFHEAAGIAERIARLRPDDPEAQLHSGIYQLLYRVDRERARAAFELALKLRPGYPEAVSFLDLLEKTPG